MRNRNDFIELYDNKTGTTLIPSILSAIREQLFLASQGYLFWTIQY